ncbi:glucuronate isomerase [Humibacter antri]
MKLQLDPDRLFPADSNGRRIARALYESVAGLPIISPHGHVDPGMLLRDEPFGDAAELFIRYDHYVTRVLHSVGISMSQLGLPSSDSSDSPAAAREVWRTFSANWHLYAGTASGYWLQSTFAEQFGLTEQPDADNADRVFDAVQAKLDSPAFRPRALFEQFRIEVLATTDDPLDDLSAHDALAADPSFTGRVVPTFRPDAYVNPLVDGWSERIQALASWNGTSAGSFRGYLDALEGRRRYFIEHGAVSADHGVAQPIAVELDGAEASRLFEQALGGTLDAEGARAFSGHMLLQMARMSVQDGLVMTVHPGVFRNHDSETMRRYGADTGHDIPVRTDYVEPLRPLLERFGNAPGFHLVLFTVDETSFSREIAPLAGFYPSVFIGAPWWFLDAPDAVQRFRAASTETAGFYKGSGFVDDTRAFMSIPARHDMSRRLDAAYLARLVGEGRIDIERAESVIVDLVVNQPKKVFKL